MDDLCVCGHPRSDHYNYILNGEPQVRCKSCDPLTSVRSSGDVELIGFEEGTYARAMYFAADHDFVPANRDDQPQPAY